MPEQQRQGEEPGMFCDSPEWKSSSALPQFGMLNAHLVFKCHLLCGASRGHTNHCNPALVPICHVSLDREKEGEGNRGAQTCTALESGEQGMGAGGTAQRRVRVWMVPKGDRPARFWVFPVICIQIQREGPFDKPYPYMLTMVQNNLTMQR